ncbi:V-type ATP synthase subunit B [Halobellus rubicundus]|uniref:A-type ATP synthase subunit B n=1 Tax=Halobellus rubicundus TaxID=2996466 RepID=A0ABD5MDX8_9EURY
MKEYQTITEISGPLVYAEIDEPIGYDEIVEIETAQGETLRGQVLESSDGVVAIQVFEGTSGIDQQASVRFLGETMKMPVTEDLLGRVLDGSGRPIDNGPDIVPDERRDIVGAAINPYSREYPEEFIETGVSAIDGMNTLVRGQKLPIFSSSGQPHSELAMQIARQASVPEEEEGEGEGSEFAVIFGAMGITAEEANEFMEDFERTGALERSVVFMNLADDPAVERTVTPRMVLTTAEYLAFEKDYHVLVILTDMTNYCEALREIGAAREEVPGRRGYPGYMYTDLAQLYERAGRIEGREGSVTQIPILTMPGDDDTHPIPDLTGYITEGQIYVDPDLNSQGIEPPINVLPSLSRLMDDGIGEGLTRADHGDVSDQMYAAYAEGEDLRDLVNIVGREALSERDNKYLDFADRFEEEFVDQGFDTNRDLEETLEIGWDLLSMLPKEELNRVDEEFIEEHYREDVEADSATEEEATAD